MKRIFFAFMVLWAGSATAQKLTVGASQLAQDYARDGYAAQQRYAGKIITVTGVIRELDNDLHGTLLVILSDGVSLEIADNQADNLDKLHDGAMIAVNCTVGDGQSLLSACEVSDTIGPRRVMHRLH